MIYFTYSAENAFVNILFKTSSDLQRKLTNENVLVFFGQNCFVQVQSMLNITN